MTSADHAAWVAARAAVWAACLTGVSAFGVLWAASIARAAARTWRGVHEHSKADECVAAAFNCSHAVDRVISKRWELDAARAANTATPFPGEAYDEAWAAWRRFQLAHVVARRYYPKFLDREAPSRVATTLNELEGWCRTFFGAYPDDPQSTPVTMRTLADNRSDAIQHNVLKEAKAIEAALTPVADVTPSWLAWLALRHSL